jgi:hypothetical protein
VDLIDKFLFGGGFLNGGGKRDHHIRAVEAVQSAAVFERVE